MVGGGGGKGDGCCCTVIYVHLSVGFGVVGQGTSDVRCVCNWGGGASAGFTPLFPVLHAN